MMSRYSNLEILEHRTIKSGCFKIELILNEEIYIEERFYIKNKLFKVIPENVKKTSDYMFLMMERKYAIKEIDDFTDWYIKENNL